MPILPRESAIHGVHSIDFTVANIAVEEGGGGWRRRVEEEEEEEEEEGEKEEKCERRARAVSRGWGAKWY